MKRISVLMMAAFVAASATVAEAAEKERGFCHAPAGAEAFIWGNKKMETYDVAIRVLNPALVGKQITGFTVPVPTDEKIEDISGWLTSELKLEKKVNAPDIASKAAVIKPEGRYDMPEIEVVFDEPYTVPEEGVYVGYSLKVAALVDDNSRYPVAVAYGVSEGGCYVHTSRTYLSWKDMVADDWGMVSLIEVNLKGDFYDNAVAVESVKPMYGLPGDAVELKAGLVNHGDGEVTSIDYTYTFGESTENGHYELPSPIAAAFGSYASVSLPVVAPEEVGSYDCTVTVTGVNGKANEDPHASSVVKMNVMSFVPVMRPLMEEFTGTWCVWCPRGFIALERMNKKYPGRFVGLSYHCASGSAKEPMQCLKAFPTSVGGFPAAVINRNGKELDPYYGTTTNVEMAIEQDWLEIADEFTIADISVDVVWEDAACTRLKATSEVKFVGDEPDSDYRVSYVLVGDNVTGEKWKGTEDEWYQLSAYAGKAMQGEDWEVFTKGGSAVMGLVFNDIVLSYENMHGIAGSLPSDIKGNEINEHSYTFDVSKVRNIYNEDIINDKSKLRVVAVLTDGRTGKIINSNTSAYPATGSVESAVADSSAEVVKTLWHDMSGRLVANPSAGIYVRTSVLSDGSVINEKVVL